jgi:hypothetical protein
VWPTRFNASPTLYVTRLVMMAITLMAGGSVTFGRTQVIQSPRWGRSWHWTLPLNTLWAKLALFGAMLLICYLLSRV